jgi:DNA-binding MarR family transcriptional regulator
VAAPDEDTGEGETLADAFWTVARRLRGTSRETLAPLDVTPSQARALRMLGHHESLRLSELSQALRIAPRSATEVVDALEERGLVHRSPDPDDRRAVLVARTEAGEAMAEAMRQARRADNERLFGRLGARDRATLARILRALAD